MGFEAVLGRLKVKKKEFIEHHHIIAELMEDETVLRMKEFRHHHFTTCLDHCHNVSYHSYKVCRFFGLDYISAARGALLHDLFLYNWRTDPREEGMHAFVHADIALKNALDVFELNEMEQDIIEKHMWPVTLKRPRFFESLIVSLMDKYCAVKEIAIGWI